MSKNGLIPIFKTGYVQNIFKDYVTEHVNKEVAVLIRVGETFVNDAKNISTYRDRTGNLRASIGYIVINNGTVINQNITGNKPEGKAAAVSFATKLKSEYPNGLVLIGFAGMNYAAAVEAKNFDVISGSAPTTEIMKNAFKKFLG